MPGCRRRRRGFPSWRCAASWAAICSAGGPTGASSTIPSARTIRSCCCQHWRRTSPSSTPRPRRRAAPGRSAWWKNTRPMPAISQPMPPRRRRRTDSPPISPSMSPTTPYSRAELMIVLLAREVAGLAHVVAGALSPLPAAAALLAQSCGPTRATILGSRRFNPFSEGGRELFDCAAEGRIDAFFLSGGQIDGAANINLVGIGDPLQPRVRFPGSFGSAYLYFLIPKIVLFREEHSRRSLVTRVDFISAPGVSPPGVYRRGGPKVLVTGLARFSFNGRFRLESVHPGHDLPEVEAATGFDFDRAEKVAETPAPTKHELALIRGRIREDLAEAYPLFAAGM